MAVPKAVRETATKHKAAEAKEPWHGARGKRDIDYVFLNDLWSIIKCEYKWNHFGQFFPNQSWVEALITGDMNVSRRVFAHMNPLHENDVKNIEAAFRKCTRRSGRRSQAGVAAATAGAPYMRWWSSQAQ